MKEVAADVIMNEFKAKKPQAQNARLFAQTYVLPDYFHKVINFPIRNPTHEEEFRTSNQSLMKIQAKAIKNIKSFIQWISFDSENDDNKLINMIFEEEIHKLKAALQKKMSEMRNYENTESIALGCLSQCLFCGARCFNPTDCKKTKVRHKTPFHRPMAFKGSSKMVNGKK